MGEHFPVKIDRRGKYKKPRSDNKRWVAF